MFDELGLGCWCRGRGPVIPSPTGLRQRRGGGWPRGLSSGSPEAPFSPPNTVPARARPPPGIPGTPPRLTASLLQRLSPQEQVSWQVCWGGRLLSKSPELGETAVGGHRGQRGPAPGARDSRPREPLKRTVLGCREQGAALQTWHKEGPRQWGRGSV